MKTKARNVGGRRAAPVPASVLAQDHADLVEGMLIFWDRVCLFGTSGLSASDVKAGFTNRLVKLVCSEELEGIIDDFRERDSSRGIKGYAYAVVGRIHGLRASTVKSRISRWKNAKSTTDSRRLEVN